MRCRISGRVTNDEIPLLVMLFYLFCDVWSVRLRGRSVLALRRPLVVDIRRRQRQVGSLAGAAHLLDDSASVLSCEQKCHFDQNWKGSLDFGLQYEYNV